LPKFFELQTGIVPQNETASWTGSDLGVNYTDPIYRIEPTEMRVNEHYIKVRWHGGNGGNIQM
jgi:hypothetical protein